MKKALLLIGILSMLFIFSCTDAKRSKLGGYGSNFKIELIGYDGTVVREWISSGKVSSENNSDGYYFKDAKSGLLIEVCGTLVITKLD